MRYLAAILLLVFVQPLHAAFTEFYCDAAAGSNLNSGSNAGSPTVSATAVTVSSLNVAATAGTPFSGVSVGEWVSVYTNGVDSVPQAIGRVTAVNNSGADVDVAAWRGGTPSSIDRAIVGGAWAGPTSSTNHPFPFMTNTMVNASGDYPRVNFKSGTEYAVEAENACNNPGPIKFQGYTTTVGDGGRAVFDGLTTGASYRMLYLNANADYCIIEDMEFKNNGDTGIIEAVRLTGLYSMARRVVVHDVSTIGLYVGNLGPCSVVECEAYNCNQNGQALYSAIYLHSNGCRAIRCISHHNSGANGIGFYTASNGAECIDCVAWANGQYGAWAAGSGAFINCDFYANGSSGLFIRGTSGQGITYIENCNFIDNGGYGIDGDGTNPISGYVVNCGFGAGTMANTSGDTDSLDDFDIIGSVTYADDVTPWNNPATGDFRIALAAAKGTGRGAFFQTDGTYSGTVAYPDIGAAQHQDAGGSSVYPIPNLNGNLQ